MAWGEGNFIFAFDVLAVSLAKFTAYYSPSPSQPLTNGHRPSILHLNRQTQNQGKFSFSSTKINKRKRKEKKRAPGYTPLITVVRSEFNRSAFRA